MTTEIEVKKKRRRTRRRRRPAAAKELPQIFFCGDPHGCFDQINQAAREYQPDALVILGDMQAPAPLEVVLEEALQYAPVWWIPGNHDSESDEMYDNLWRSKLADKNLHGRAANVCGVRIAGLGGVFRGQVWMPDDPPNYYCPATFIRRVGPGNVWRGGVPRRHRTTIFPSVYQNLMRQHADILVTLEAPSCHRKGFAAIDRLAEALGVKRLFHGHQHEDRAYGRHHGIIMTGVGYRGITSITGEVVIPAQLDPREAAALKSALEWADSHGIDAPPVRTPPPAMVVRTPLPHAAPTFQPPELHPSSDMKPAPSSIKEAEAEQEKRTSRMTRARNRALAEAEKREPRRDAMLGRAVSARAPGGRWKRMQPKKKTGAGSDGGA